MALYQFKGRKPRVAHGAFVAEYSLVICDVQIGKGSYIGHGAILRSDYGTLFVAERKVIEEGVLVKDSIHFVFSLMDLRLNN